jgi:endonuclease-8
VPEGDTVYRTARMLHRALVGHRLTGADLRLPRLATADLAGGIVAESVSRGKHLLLRVRLPGPGEPLTLHSHLGMDGSWRVYRPGGRWPDQPGHLVRAVLRTPVAVAVGCQLRDLHLVPTDRERHLLAGLGPDLLDRDADVAEAARRLARDPTATVATALRNQGNLAGIGNVYCSELLFLRGTWPWTPVGAVADLPALVRLAHRVLMANRERPVRTTTGSLRRGETTYVYGRGGCPCRRCGTTIESEDAGRVVYWCLSCQPAPDPGAEPGPAGRRPSQPGRRVRRGGAARPGPR